MATVMIVIGAVTCGTLAILWGLALLAAPTPLHRELMRPPEWLSALSIIGLLLLLSGIGLAVVQWVLP